MSHKNIKNGEDNMTRELALSLLSRKSIYLTPEGKRILEIISKEKNICEGK